MAFNPQDPRYQRDIQSAASKASMRGTPNFGVMRDISTKHAERQEASLQRLTALGLQSQLAEQSHELKKAKLEIAGKELDLSGRRADTRFELDSKRLDWKKDMFNKEMKQRKDNMKWTIGLGLGTAGLSYVESERRADALEEERRLRERAYELQKRESDENRAWRQKYSATLDSWLGAQ